MGFEVGYGAATIAGLLSFLSPCILPMVPFYLCYIAGLSFDELSPGQAAPRRSRIVAAAMAFSLGIVVVFVALGASATLIGQYVRAWFDVLRYGAAAVILVLGLHFLGLVRLSLLDRQARLDPGDRRWGLLGALLIGMAFAFGWTPCVGPVLAAILFTAGAQQTADQGALLLLAYALGMTAPFVAAAAAFGPFLDWSQRFRRRLRHVEAVTGGALVLFAALIATDSMGVIAGWMLAVAPDIGTLQ
ncbi:MAG: cytochrome c biogenesis protein CcdA [Pseudomonadota bacterium]